MTTNIEERYQRNELTAAELPALRQHLDATDDEAIEAGMREEWERGDTDTAHIDEARMDAVWERISARIAPSTNLWGRMWKAVQVAAVIILPLLMLFSYHLYHQNAALSDNTVRFSTGPQEQATIVLPDGSQVMLNELSALSYDSRRFNRLRRQMEFRGEAFFEVAKDPEHPFTINNKNVEISVLGTKFNLRSRDDEAQDELALAEGQVRFTAVGSGASVCLSPSQRAILDRQTGQISVTGIDRGMEELTAWRRKEFVFRNTPLSIVLQTISKHYGVTIEHDRRLNLDDLFTGTMSSTSINEDLAILETSYHLRFMLHDNKVVIRK